MALELTEVLCITCLGFRSNLLLPLRVLTVSHVQLNEVLLRIRRYRTHPERVVLLALDNGFVTWELLCRLLGEHG
jgi:hypothetical protein